MHDIGKMRDALLINWDSMKEDSKLISRVLTHLDLLVTTINLCFNTPVSDWHSCQKNNAKLCDDLQDYVDFVNKLQRHTKCSPSYYFHVKNDQQYCRFGFSKENVDHSFICENNCRQPKLITVRNDLYANTYNCLQLQGWRANINL